MNAQRWLIFLVQIQNCFVFSPILFKLEDSVLTAQEGSCIEIKCSVTHKIDTEGAYWFWMKNRIWNNIVSSFSATIPYSTNTAARPVSPDFAGRVKYIGSSSSDWETRPPAVPQCGILICNLKKTDSGNYSFRFIGKEKWATEIVDLIVTDNPCPITFEKLPVVNKTDTMTLKCSTLSSCPSKLQIEGFTQQQLRQAQRKGSEITVGLTVNWQDHGKEFSCQTQDNKDVYLIRNVSVTVEYAPRDILAAISPVGSVKERQSVTLTCSAKAHPEPTFTWFKNKQEHAGAQWNFPSIEESQSGEYYCNATNTHGRVQSGRILINVTYLPQVDVKISPASVVNQGDTINLTCNVERSNPQPYAFTWWKNGNNIGSERTYGLQSIEPEDRGNYSCGATNTVGLGKSVPHQIVVYYRPRNTRIHNSKSDTKVKVGDLLTFTCDTDANPAPFSYSWYHHNQNSSQWKEIGNENHFQLHWDRVQRVDETCYRCKATNTISAGEESEAVCIQVLYSPTKPRLSMDTEVTEGQLVTISCTVESFPLSRLTLTRTSASNPQSSESPFPSSNDEARNTLQRTFNVTSTHAGLYTCTATNSIGSSKSMQRKLVVKYRPKDVTVQAQPGLVVKENMSLTLHCSTHCYPPVTSVYWMKITDGRSEFIQDSPENFMFIKSVSPSDSGLYSCTARNEMGTGNSQQAEVKVKYAPNHTEIIRGPEQPEADGMTSVRLSCSSHSFPPAMKHSWYKKMKAEDRDVKVSDHQNYTVYSNQPGVYYCIAENEINQRASEPVHLFVDRGLLKILMFSLFVIIVSSITVTFFFCRHKRNTSRQQGTTAHFGFLGWWNGTRGRNLMNDTTMAEPFRSRDDLLTDQPCRPNAHRHQPPPDSTPASNISTVYCAVNLPAGKQGPSAQTPITKPGGHAEDHSLNYTSIHFDNKQRGKQTQAEQGVVYSVVSKSPKKNEQRRLEDYENVKTSKYPNPLDYDTDTSEDEVELNYHQVTFNAKPGHHRDSTDSSTSDEEGTQYSQIKL